MINIQAKHLMNDSIINIVIPMAGSGSRFTNAGYQDPKPLIDVFGKPMIETVICNLIPKQKFKFVFVCKSKDFESYNLQTIFNSALGSNWEYILTDTLSDGPASTVMLAEQFLSDSDELIIANADQIVDADLTKFIDDARNLLSDGLIMTFPAKDERWSYAKLDIHGKVKEVAEKKVISDHATVGIYYFANCKIFKDGYRKMREKNLRVNGEFYVAPIYNELLNIKKNIRIWEIEEEEMHGIGTPDDLEMYFNQKGGYVSKSGPLKNGI